VQRPATTQSSSQVSTGSAGDDNQYTAPLDSACVGHFYDHSPGGGGWWAFRNECGQPIHLGFIALNGTGAAGGSGASADIPAGGTHNTGQSPAEVRAAGGGYLLFVCPAGSYAVSANGASLSAANTAFRCKRL
jgi:hypothetical protein